MMQAPSRPVHAPLRPTLRSSYSWPAEPIQTQFSQPGFGPNRPSQGPSGPSRSGQPSSTRPLQNLLRTFCGGLAVLLLVASLTDALAAVLPAAPNRTSNTLASASTSASTSTVEMLRGKAQGKAAPAISFNLPDGAASGLNDMALDVATAVVVPTATPLFQGGSASLVAKAVGSAEGTRRPDGGKNPAYKGHVDPGNGKWNLGSFSYQHGASSPEEADVKQLRRLQLQYQMIQDQAKKRGLTLGVEEQLNAIDLANQSPLAALEADGYIDRLAQAYQQGYRGGDAILQARVYSYFNTRTNFWDAPGLGNTEASIRHDQARRQAEVASALALHQDMLARSGKAQSVSSR
jgi:hypothetical protein